MDRSPGLLTARCVPRRNQRWLQAYAASRSQRRRLRCRDALVRANLPLVRQVAARVAPRTGLPFDDLAQVGSLGLIRAIEAFDPRRRVRFSSFAVPYIRGAIAHELRDRGSLLRIPRPLWELRQRATSLEQQLRRERGGGPARAELAERLGCPPEQLAEALALQQLTDPRSLDAPLAGEGGEGSPLCLLDLLAAPAAASPAEIGEEDDGDDGDGGDGGDGGDDGDDGDEESERCRWLRQQLDALPPELRELLTGRLLQGCSWVELGRNLGLSPRMAQRRHAAALARLQEAARDWSRQRQSNP
jgi:RNA polymerase sigma-B factor